MTTQGAEVGEVRLFASGSQGYLDDLARKGWIPCDGRALSHQDPRNKPLFRAIGTQWGYLPSDQPHTFRVPDLRGMFVRGWAPAGDLESFQRNDPDRDQRKNWEGNVVGSVVGSFQLDALAQHNHLLNTQRWGANLPFVANAQWYLGGNVDGQNDTARTGGSETRPRNAYLLYAIFSGVAQL